MLLGIIEVKPFAEHNPRGDREINDYYATPPVATLALLEKESFVGNILEPCCGEGHISKILEANGYTVESNDLIDRGYGSSRIDFLLETTKVDNVVTNPPYKNALDFVRKATDLADKKVAMLLKLNFLEGVKRKEFFKTRPPARVYVFSSRQSLMKGGVPHKGGMMALAWFVWENGSTEKPILDWIL